MSYTSLFYHVVFSTKGRRPFLKGDLPSRIVPYAGGIIRQQKGRLIQGACVCDHCHLAVTIHPTAAIADFIRVLKCNLSGWLHKTSPDMKSFAWHDGYAAFSVSSSVLPRVIEYISTQQEHHKKMSFQEELISLLDKHGVEYDKQYILA